MAGSPQRFLTARMSKGERANLLAMRRKRTVQGCVLVTALALGLVTATPALAGSAGIELRSNVTRADDSVGVKVSLGGFPNELCRGRIVKDGRVADAGEVRTSSNGGAVWSWVIPGNVSAGIWNFSVTCSGGVRTHHAHTSFLADAGVGDGARGLWVPGTLHSRKVIQAKRKGGNGGDGGTFYPIGQSTWWVAIHRPDLPFFPGRSGDALNWAKTAAARGFPVGKMPLAGAVAVFQPHQYGAGPFGHVAIVVAVLGDKIKISETGLAGGGGHDTRIIGTHGLRFIYHRGNPAPSLFAILTSPADGARVSGTATITAESNAPAVRFAVYSYASPADLSSGEWQALGEDVTPADGFTTTWDTTQTPNQGGLGTGAVMVRAVVIGSDGSPTGAVSELGVAVSNSRSRDGQTYFPYYVVGTCREEECGLPVRAGPGFSLFGVVGGKHDGDEVDIVCQAAGQTFVSKFGGSSAVWDKLTDGGWVSDYFVDTPVRGNLSAPIPTCS